MVSFRGQNIKHKRQSSVTVSRLSGQEVSDISFLPCNIKNPTLTFKFLISYIEEVSQTS